MPIVTFRRGGYFSRSFFYFRVVSFLHTFKHLVLYIESALYKRDWASLIVGSKFTVFALFYFYLWAIFEVQAPRGLIFGGAYTWRGLFSEFYGILLTNNSVLTLICCSTHNWNVLVCCLRDRYEQRGWLLSKYKAPLYRKNLQLYKRKILRQNLQIYHSQQHNLGMYENVTETGHSRVPRTPIFKTRQSVTPSLWKWFLFVENENSLSYQWLYTLPRFETEAWVQLGNGL